MIRRSNPSLENYVPAEMISDTLGFHQVVSYNGLLFLGGIAPVSGAALEIVTPGDLKGQCAFVLDILGKSLAAGGSSAEQLLDWTVYLKDVDGAGAIGAQYLEIVPQLKAFVGANGPSATAVGVHGLFVPEQLIEIQAIAATSK
ncbi:RidA family protein [Rhodococcus erythropolis]|uniref:RidA family protein n=1 Tax=Rhodococcus erythropolis TaxID=1833 RepID=UPI001C9A61B8|nr:RidA family protein [Rhodococcus erythropolis]MBY6382494.1 RidA family protein [Rhodococcus erythropolis]